MFLTELLHKAIENKDVEPYDWSIGMTIGALGDLIGRELSKIGDEDLIEKFRNYEEVTILLHNTVRRMIDEDTP